MAVSQYVTESMFARWELERRLGSWTRHRLSFVVAETNFGANEKFDVREILSDLR